MSLIPKCPMEVPCEASSFEEAFRKNAIRLCFERNLARDDHMKEKTEGKEPHDVTDPAFWEGAMAANAKAFEILEREMKKALREAMIHMEHTVHTSESKAFTIGFQEIMKMWKEALEKNDPSHVVFW